MTMIPVYTIRYTASGEQVVPDILLNGSNIPVNYERLPVTKQLFPGAKIVSAFHNGHDKQLLTHVLVETLPKGIRTNYSWESYNEETKEYFEIVNNPIGALVLLKARCRTNLRCPMERDFWVQRVNAEKLRSKETGVLKASLQENFRKEYNLLYSGVSIVLPSLPVTNQRDRKEYLIAMAEGSSVEYIFDRTDGKPNAYRIECTNGEVSLIDPRAEVRLHG